MSEASYHSLKRHNFQFGRMIHLPSISLPHRSRDVSCDCHQCIECCGRCLTHWWFCTICCSFVVISSFPRASAILDFALSLVIYLASVRPHGEDGVSIASFVRSDFTDYHFSTSANDVVIVSFVRSCILFFCFAYRYQRDGYKVPILVSLIVASISSLFLIAKLSTMTAVGQYPLLIFSLIYVWAAVLLFIAVRRRRIRMRPPLVSIKTESVSYRKLSTPQNKTRKSSDDCSDEKQVLTAITRSADPDSSDVVIIEEVSVQPTSLSESHFDSFARTDSLQNAHQLGNVVLPPPLTPSRRSSVKSVPQAEYDKAESILAEFDSQYIEIDGVNVHYRVFRRSDDRSNLRELPVILLHGFGGGVFSWRRVFSEISSLVSVLVAFDRPGFGLTSKPLEWSGDENPYSANFSVNLTFQLMDYLEIQSAVLVGHSTGAAIACLCALRHPERVLGIVSIAQSEGLPKFIRSILKTKLGHPIIMRLVRSEIGDVAIRRAWHDPDSIPADIIRNHKQCLKVKNWGEALLAMARVSRTRLLVDDQLADISCRVLILHGEDDKLVALSGSQRLARKFPLCEIVRIDDCGHIPHEERPARFVVEVRAFLDKVARATFDEVHSPINGSPVMPSSSVQLQPAPDEDSKHQLMDSHPEEVDSHLVEVVIDD